MMQREIDGLKKHKLRNDKKRIMNGHKTRKQGYKSRYSTLLPLIKSLPSVSQQHLIISQTPYIFSTTLPPYIHNGEYNTFYHKLYDFLTLITLDYYTDRFRPKTKRIYTQFIDYTQETLSKVKQFLFYSNVANTMNNTKVPQFHKERNKSIDKMVTVQSDEKAEKKYTRNRTTKSPDFWVNKEWESLEDVKETEQQKIKDKFYSKTGKNITTKPD